MKYLKRYNQLNESIKSKCDDYGIESYTINDDGTVNVEGDVYLNEGNLTKLPLKFGRVTGGFYCQDNRLISLIGAPREVGNVFNCDGNQLTSLQGGPREVGGDFICSSNLLQSLEGAPMEVGGDFICNRNRLTSLKGAPMRVSYFDCDDNQLTSLVGGPKLVDGFFDCRQNKLVTLEGAPDCYDFYCGGNPVHVVWSLFNDNKRFFLEKLNGMYTGSLSPFIIKDGHNYLRGDILEEIADELGVTLPTDWSVKVERAGYTVI